MSVSNSNNLHAGSRFPKDDKVGKLKEHYLACAKSIFGELFWVIFYAADRVFQLAQKTLRSPNTALAIPFNGGFSFLQRERVDLGGRSAHRRSLALRRTRASVQGIG